MRNKRNTNALSVTILVSIIAILACAILFILYHEFGLLGGEVNKNTDYTIKFIVKSDENVNIDNDKRIYLSNSREFFGIVRGITYNENNQLVVTVDSKGFYKDDIFLLNGKTEIALGSELFIMNNHILIQITNIY